MGAGARTKLSWTSEATALMTVVLETPNFLAIAAFGTPSMANLWINASPPAVITL